MNAPRFVFLLIGQSNMAGRAALDEEASMPTARVFRFGPYGAWEPASDPLHQQELGYAGTGPGMSFAHVLAKAMPDIEIGLVPCAVGATALARWVKGGDLFENAVQRTRAALENGGILAAILWHQGESDARSEADAATYSARLAGMIHNLREELGAEDAPFIAGELGTFLTPADFPGAAQVNAALHELAGRAARCMCVSSAGLVDKGDRKHFDTASQRELGRRYAAAFLNHDQTERSS
jgi:hypothetical protein